MILKKVLRFSLGAGIFILLAALSGIAEAKPTLADPYIIQPRINGGDGIFYFDEAKTQPSWANPEIRIFTKQGNKDVTDIGINQNSQYYMKVYVHNLGNEAASNVTVTGWYSKFGSTNSFKRFGEPVTIGSIAPKGTAEAKIYAKSSIAGHVCVQATLTGETDVFKGNNVGQRNLWIEAATPGRPIVREVAVSNSILVMQADGSWLGALTPKVQLQSFVSILPLAQNTPANQTLVRVSIDPSEVTFPEDGTVQTTMAKVNINFDKKLPSGMRVIIHVRPIVEGGKPLMDGSSFDFNVTKVGVKRHNGGM